MTRPGDARLWLADDFFLVALDDRTCRLGLHPSAMGVGLAGALLGELMLWGNITIDAGRLAVVNRQPPWDVLAHSVLERLASEQHDLHVWLAFLAQTAVDEVAARLAQRQFITRHESRGWRRTTVTFVPTDINTVAWRPVRLETALTRREPMNPPDRLLAGLVWATDLAQRVLWNADSGAFRYLQAVVAEADPPIRELVTQVQAQVGNAILSHRR